MSPTMRTPVSAKVGAFLYNSQVFCLHPISYTFSRSEWGQSDFSHYDAIVLRIKWYVHSIFLNYMQKDNFTAQISQRM